MANYRLLDKARADLDNLYEHGILTFGLHLANKFYDEIIEQLVVLGQSPKLYRERWELSPPVRICPFKPYVILYTIKQNQTVIVRVRHEREDWVQT